jgi:hypothetical protein
MAMAASLRSRSELSATVAQGSREDSTACHPSSAGPDERLAQLAGTEGAPPSRSGAGKWSVTCHPSCYRCWPTTPPESKVARMPVLVAETSDRSDIDQHSTTHRLMPTLGDTSTARQECTSMEAATAPVP